jgi:hypothetical protein
MLPVHTRVKRKQSRTRRVTLGYVGPVPCLPPTMSAPSSSKKVIIDEDVDDLDGALRYA